MNQHLDDLLMQVARMLWLYRQTHRYSDDNGNVERLAKHLSLRYWMGTWALQMPGPYAPLDPLTGETPEAAAKAALEWLYDGIRSYRDGARESLGEYEKQLRDAEVLMQEASF